MIGFARPSGTLKSSVSTLCSNFEIRHWKILHSRLSKVTLHYETAPSSEATSVSPTAQLDFSWTLQISDRQNDWFARPSQCLSSSVSAT